MPNRLTKIVGAGISAGTATYINGDLQDNVVAAGSTQATATPVSGDNIVVVTTPLNSGVILGGATFSPGDVIQVANLGANALLVYPPVGGTINALAQNAGFSVAAGKAAFLTVRATATNFIAALSA